MADRGLRGLGSLLRILRRLRRGLCRRARGGDLGRCRLRRGLGSGLRLLLLGLRRLGLRRGDASRGVALAGAAVVSTAAGGVSVGAVVPPAFGNTPVMAAVAARLATITAPAAVAISG